MKNLKHHNILTAVFCLLSFFSTMTLAADQPQPQPQVAFSLNADQWVTSNSANVTVTIHASKTQEQLANMQNNILQKLKKIAASSKWHITQINRKQSQANLEQLDVVAEARLPTTALADLRSKAKSVSQQGEAYDITSIDYTPTDAELNKAQADLRQQIYQQAKDELARLNQMYPKQNYNLFNINFNGPIMPQPSYRNTTMVMAANQSQPETADGANVSQHLRLSAQVILGARTAAD